MIKNLLSFLSIAFAAQIPAFLTDPNLSEGMTHIAPAFGVAYGIVWIGGMRYLPAIFFGALLPSFYMEEGLLLILSEPTAIILSAVLSLRFLNHYKLSINLARIRDVLFLIFYAILLSTCFGAIIQSALRYMSEDGIIWNHFMALFWVNWTGAAVGAVVMTPFMLAWADRGGLHLGVRQFIEVVIWLITLVIFGFVTFRSWAPSDVLFYPLELAIFPIMTWAAIRFGLRGASAGVLLLAILAAGSMILVDVNFTQQSSADAWIFVAVVSITSVCLAALMAELRQREAQIIENESRLRAFTAALPDVAFVLSSNGVVLDVLTSNHAIKANHGIIYSNEVVGQSLDSLFDTSLSRSFLEAISAALRTNTAQTLEYALKSTKMRTHWFDAQVSAIPVSEGQSDRVLWVAYDVTSRKTAEFAVIERDNLLTATARANYTLLTTVDFSKAIEFAMREIGTALGVDRALIFEISGRSDESFHRCNPRFEWLKNDTLQSVLAHRSLKDAPFEDFFPGWYEQLTTGDIIRSGGQEEQSLGSNIFRELESQSLLVIPMWVEGNLHGFFAVDYCRKEYAWNQSEINAVRVLAASISGLILMHEREDELRIARDQADSASVAKGDFLAQMSHEIRTPMNAIIGYTDLMLQTNLDTLQTEQISIIKRSGKALLNLINNILDYSKIESRTLELESVEFDIEQLISEAIEYVDPDAIEKGVEINYEIDPLLSETYVGDVHQIRQVLMNLANNAVKFTVKGSVLISVSKNVKQSDALSDAIHFEVEDSGYGIPRDKFDRLFKPFTQVDPSTTREYGGTGLGLVICQRLVEQMNGKIWVESAIGVGSNFQFIIPLPRPDQIRASRAPFVISAHSNNEDRDELSEEFATEYPLRILVCEDDNDNQWVIKELLEIMGYRPKVVDDGVKAMEFMQRREYDVVLMDVRLPDHNGIELTRAIRKGTLTNCKPDQYIIAVTAFAMNEDRDKCLKAGMNDYLSKPIEVSLLKDALIKAHSTLMMS